MRTHLWASKAASRHRGCPWQCLGRCPVHPSSHTALLPSPNQQITPGIIVKGPSKQGLLRFSAALPRDSPPLCLLWAGDAEAAPSEPCHAALSYHPKYQQVLPYPLLHTTPPKIKSLLQYPACLSCKLSQPRWASASPHLQVLGCLCP